MLKRVRSVSPSLTLWVSLFLVGCVSSQDEIFMVPEPVEAPYRVLAFVGEKVEIFEFVSGSMDHAYLATYKVLEVVHGSYASEQIRFEAYDHYGLPAFAKSDIALIYLLEVDGGYVHSKYQFDRVYPTKSGRFASCGDPYRNLKGGHRVNRQPLEKIDFDPPVVFEIAEGRDEQPSESFRSPYYSFQGKTATCRMGAYTDELYSIRYEHLIAYRMRSTICDRHISSLELANAEDADFDVYKARRRCIKDLKSRGLP